MIVLLILMVVFIVVFITCIPIYNLAKTGRLDRNRAIGIKTRATLASDDAWKRGHKAGAPWILSSALVALTGAAGSGLLALFLGDSVSNVDIAIVVLFGFGGVIGTLVTAAVVASRAAAAT